MPFGGLLTAGIIGATSIYGAKKAKDAAKTQVEAGDKALDFEKRQYADVQQNYAPWRAAGTGAMLNLAGAFGVPMVGNQGPVNPRSVASGQVPMSAFGGAPQDPMVMVEAPNGRGRKLVPQWQAQHYASRGARIIPTAQPRQPGVPAPGSRAAAYFDDSRTTSVSTPQ